jgi:hypothetical protein
VRLRAVRALIARAHPDLTIAEFTVTWVTKPKRFPNRHGGGWYTSATVLVQAPGYTTRKMIVQEDEDSFWIR